jgi:hypothetical protein
MNAATKNDAIHERERLLIDALMSVDMESTVPRDANILGDQMKVLDEARMKNEQSKGIVRMRTIDIIVLAAMLVVTVIFKLSIASIVMFIATERIANIIVAATNRRNASVNLVKQHDKLINDFVRINKVKTSQRGRRK